VILRDGTKGHQQAPRRLGRCTEDHPVVPSLFWIRGRSIVLGCRVRGVCGVRVLPGVWSERSATRPVPAHSRTASIPATAANLSSKPDDTATTNPLPSRSRNLNCDCASTNNSKRPAMVFPPADGEHPAQQPSVRACETACCWTDPDQSNAALRRKWSVKRIGDTLPSPVLIQPCGSGFNKGHRLTASRESPANCGALDGAQCRVFTVGRSQRTGIPAERSGPRAPWPG
jgi:hypothetical protein